MRRIWILLAVLTPLMVNAATFGPEIPIAVPEYGLSVGEQVAASLACNDQSCLAVWFELSSGGSGLYSGVIDSDGTVHTATSNLLRTGNQGSSSLVWTGDHYLAVWNDGATRTLVAAPLSRDGLLTGPVQSLTTFPQDVSPNALAWDGHHALVVFNPPGGGLEGVILDANGNLVRTFVLPSSQQAAMYSVAAAGQTFAVAWTGSSSAYIERFDDSGAPLDANPIALGSNVSRVGLASDGSRFGVAFVTSEGSLQRLRIDAATGAIETLPPASFSSQLLGVYWSGDDFVAYAPDINNIDTQQFTSDTVRMLDVSTKFILGPQVVQGPSGAVAIWIDSRPTGTDQHLLGAILDRDATVIRQRDIAVARSAVPQTVPGLALSPFGALLVWQLDRGDEVADSYATRLDRSGKPIDSAPILISHSGARNNERAVLWIGDSYLVVYPGGSTMVGKRISASGAVLDTDPIVYAHGDYVALASNGTTTILAMSQANTFVRLLRLNAAGGVIDSQTIAANNHISNHLAIAANGDEFAVVWTEDHGDGFEVVQDDIFAVRLSATGLPMDASPIVIANSPSDESSPAIASDGRDFLIAYVNGTNIRVKRLLREGTVTTGTFVAEGNASPQVAFAGDRYFLTWSDLALARTATLDEAGVVIDPPSTFAQSDSGVAVRTALVPGLVAYSRGNAAANGIPQLYTRQIVFPAARLRAVRH